MKTRSDELVAVARKVHKALKQEFKSDKYHVGWLSPQVTTITMGDKTFSIVVREL